MKDPMSGHRPPAQKSFRFCSPHQVSQPLVETDADELSQRHIADQPSNFADNLDITSSKTDSSCFGSAQTVLSRTPDANLVSPVLRSDTESQPLTDHLLVSSLLANVTVPQQSDAKALPLGWILGPKDRASFVDRVLARLIQSEAHELNPHLKADYRQSQICLILAARGNTEPFVVSSYQMYGVHPDKVFPKVMALRRAMLGKEFSDWYDEAGNLKPEVPKKESAGAPSPEPQTALATSGDLPSGPPKKPSSSIPRTQREEQA